jgi:hypothetical protein
MEKKICSKCKIEKEVCEFNKDKSKRCGYRSECKPCQKNYSAKYRLNTFDKRKLYREENQQKIKLWRQSNIERIYINKKQYREKNSLIISEQKKRYYEDNREKTLLYNKEYRITNREKFNNYGKNYREKNISNPIFKLSSNLRRRIRCFFKSKMISKNNKSFEIIGCSPEFLKEHLEKQFTDGMSWENHGLYGWHIDHIIPLSSAKTEEEVYELCHYTNLQPLWSTDNLKKGAKIKS